MGSVGDCQEKELKGWNRTKKITLIRSFNPEFEFLNDSFKSRDVIPPSSE